MRPPATKRRVVAASAAPAADVPAKPEAERILLAARSAGRKAVTRRRTVISPIAYALLLVVIPLMKLTSIRSMGSLRAIVRF